MNAQPQPPIRLAGFLTVADVTHDGVDVLLTVALRTGKAEAPVFAEVTIAVDGDDVPALRDALDEQWGQLGATSSAIDDHDEAADEARDLEVA